MMNIIHEDIKELITALHSNLGEVLKDKLYGLYIYNSVAMGKFEPKYSDIDFMVVIISSLTEDELNHVDEMHKRLTKEYQYGSKLDGIYMLYENIGKANNEMKPYPYIHKATFYKEGYFDINYVTWWSLKEYDMAIESPSIKQELSHINWDCVLRTMEYNLNRYWASKLTEDEIEKFEEDMWVEFGVVTLSRIFYTVKKGRIVSKTEGCHYVLQDYSEYQGIVKEALAIRDLRPRSIIHNVSDRRDQAVEFIRTMINYSNELLKRERII